MNEQKNYNTINYTTLSLLKRETIEKITDFEINPNTEDKKNILNSIQLGPNDNSSCLKCGKIGKNCVGHYGSIKNVKLYKSLFNVVLRKLINGICHKCFGKIQKTKNTCIECGEKKLYDYKKEDSNKDDNFNSNNIEEIVRITRDSNNKDKEKVIMTRDEIIEILKNISDETAKSFGYDINRPIDLISEHLLILPKKYRKQNKINGKVLNNIFSNLYNNILKELNKINSGDYNSLLKGMKNIQYFESIIVNNKNSSSNITNPTFSQIISGKEGLFQNGILTKRTTPALRSVIIPADPRKQNIDEIGIPKIYAKEVIIHDIITKYNIESFSRILSLTNDNSYEKIIYKYSYENNNENNIKFLYLTSSDKLEIGNLIGRSLLKGDVVCVNRTPTLTKSSILAFKVILTNEKAISLNISLCKGFAADFDGDEMNVFISLDPHIRNEMYFKMLSKYHIVSGVLSKILISPIQDNITSLYILSKNNFSVLESIKNLILFGCKTYEKDIIINNEEGIKYYRGKDIISMLLPNDFNYISDNKDLVIKNGYFISGLLNKSSIMYNQKGIITALLDLYNDGCETAKIFIDNLQILSTNFLKIYGLTTSLRDFYFDEDIMDNIRFNKEKDYLNVFRDLSKNESLTNNIDRLLTQNISNISNKNKIIDDLLLKENNHFHDIYSSGGKGDIGHLYKSMYTVGEIPTSNKRFISELNSIASNDSFNRIGIIKSSYLEGLNSNEIEMGNENALVSVIQQQVQTAGPGYINKKTGEIARNFIFCADYTIRHLSGQVFLLHYFNSFDAQKESEYKIPNNKNLLLLDEDDIKKYNIKDVNKYNSFINMLFKELLDENKNIFERKCIENFKIYLPFDFNLIFNNLIDMDDNIKNPFKDIEEIMNLIEHKILRKYKVSNDISFDYIYKREITFALIYYLHPKRINISKNNILIIIDKIIYKILFSQVSHGSPVLLDAGSSLNAGLTQSLLSSIHNIDGGDDATSSLISNFNISKDKKLKKSDNDKELKNINKKIITTYVSKKYKDLNFKKLLFKDLIDEVICTLDINIKIENEYDIIKQDIIPKEILKFVFKINIKEMVNNKLILAIIQYKIIEYLYNNINNLTELNYLKIGLNNIKEDPNIIIFIDLNNNNLRYYIEYFIEMIKNINFKESNINNIFIESQDKDLPIYRCFITGLEYVDTFKNDYFDKSFIGTSYLYDLYLYHGLIGYYMGTLTHLKELSNINPKHIKCISSLFIYKGSTPLPITRTGLKRVSSNYWSSIAFEFSIPHLIDGIMKETICDDKEFSARTLYGNVPLIADGCLESIIDLEDYKKYSKKIIIKKNNKDNNIKNLLNHINSLNK